MEDKQEDLEDLTKLTEQAEIKQRQEEVRKYNKKLEDKHKEEMQKFKESPGYKKPIIRDGYKSITDMLDTHYKITNRLVYIIHNNIETTIPKLYAKDISMQGIINEIGCNTSEARCIHSFIMMRLHSKIQANLRIHIQDKVLEKELFEKEKITEINPDNSTDDDLIEAYNNITGQKGNST